MAGEGHELQAMFSAGSDVFRWISNGMAAEGGVHVTINFHEQSLEEESDGCMSNDLKKAKRRPKTGASIGVQNRIKG